MTKPDPGGREHDTEDGPPLRRPKRKSRLLEGARDDGDDLLGGPRDDRQHHDRERERRGESGLTVLLLRHHPEEIDEETGDDGRRARHGVDHVADDPGEGIPVVHQIGGGEDPEGNGEERGQANLLDRSHDGRPGTHRGDRRIGREARHVRHEEMRKVRQHHREAL